MNQYYRYRGISTGERQTTHYPARVLSCFTCTPLFCVFLTSGEFVNWNLRIWKVSPYIWYVPSAFEQEEEISKFLKDKSFCPLSQASLVPSRYFPNSDTD